MQLFFYPILLSLPRSPHHSNVLFCWPQIAQHAVLPWLHTSSNPDPRACSSAAQTCEPKLLNTQPSLATSHHPPFHTASTTATTIPPPPQPHRYGPVQSEAEVKKEELAEIKIKTAQLEREADQSAQQTKTIANQVRALTSKPTTEDATKQVADLKVTNQAATEKVAALTAAAGNIKPEDKARIEKEYNANVGEWKKRKRLIKNITDTILENYPKSKKALYDDIGVETDEAAGIDIGTF